MPELGGVPIAPPSIPPFAVRAYLQPRAWGGTRFPAVDDQPVGEAWLVDDRCQVTDGPYTGRSLADLTSELGAELVGEAVDDRWAGHFPLRIKILDAAEWLSVQVHPDTAVARRRHGPDAVGKDEAWFILDAPPGAELVAGLVPGTEATDLEAAFATPRVRDFLDYLPITIGDAVTVEAGLVHSIPPGVSVYEIQEPSDLTYRLYDWDRPASLGRSLDREASLAAVKLDARPKVARAGESANLPPLATVATSGAFRLRRASPIPGRIAVVDVEARSVVTLTAVSGKASVVWKAADGDSAISFLDVNDTLVVPANPGRLEISAPAPATVLVGSVV